MKFNSKWAHIEHKNRRNNITVEKSKTYITNKARRFPFRFKTFDLECYKPTLNTNKNRIIVTSTCLLSLIKKCSRITNVVNAVLLKLCLELYQSRYNPSAINVNQDTNSSAINVKPMNTILSALNVTQGHKRSYQTSSESINAKSLDAISA